MGYAEKCYDSQNIIRGRTTLQRNKLSAHPIVQNWNDAIYRDASFPATVGIPTI